MQMMNRGDGQLSPDMGFKGRDAQVHTWTEKDLREGSMGSLRDEELRVF